MSNDGNDSNDGSITAPLNTLDKAKSIVKENKGNYTEGAEVIIREGEYRFTESAVFTAADSGTVNAPVTYRAYTGENVEFKGSVVVDATKTIEITDSRVQENVKNNIVAIDLTAAGVDASLIRAWADMDSEKILSNGEMNTVYINNEVQTLAQWPNGEEYATFTTDSSGNDLIYTAAEPDNWGNATDFWLGGYFKYDYAYTRKSVTAIDTENNTITLHKNENSDSIDGDNEMSNRWKAFNLLEELDAPGEYYIDTVNNILYLYPSQNIENAEVELSFLNQAILLFNEADNISVEGINFSQTRGSAVSLKNVDNIDIKNCNFDDITGNAIATPYETTGLTMAQTDAQYWQIQPLDVANNCDITGCDFNNIGASAIILYGGNVDTLTKSNNIVLDNKITTVAQLTKNASAIRMGGCGNTISNNEISDAPFQAITHFGNDHIISYNNIYDVIKEADDCAAIYCGRNTLQRGTVIEYNYIHDLKESTAPRGFNGAIYWDDRQTGMTAKNNIIENVNIGFIVNGGVDFEISNNVLINVRNECTDSTVPGSIHVINGGVCVNNNGGAEVTGNKFGSVIANPQLYYTSYPHLEELITGECYNNSSLAKFNIVKENTLVSSDAMTIGTNTVTYGVVTQNNTATSYDKTNFTDFDKIGLLTNR